MNDSTPPELPRRRISKADFLRIAEKRGVRLDVAEWAWEFPRTALAAHWLNTINVWTDPAQMSALRHNRVHAYIEASGRNWGISDLKSAFDAFGQGTAFERWIRGERPRKRERTNYQALFGGIFDYPITPERVAAFVALIEKGLRMQSEGSGRKQKPRKSFPRTSV